MYHDAWLGSNQPNYQTNLVTVILDLPSIFYVCHKYDRKPLLLM